MIKEVVLPFTSAQVWKILIVLGWLVTILIPTQFGITQYWLIIFAATTTITLLIPIFFEWDMNPFHKIGYCIRLKDSDTSPIKGNEDLE